MDRKLYKKNMQATLHGYTNLDIRAGSVFDLVLGQPAVSADFPRSEVRGVTLGTFILVFYIH